MECLADIRDGHCEVINRTQGFMSSQNMVRSSNVFLVHSEAYSSSPSILERGHSLVEPRLGPVWLR